MNYQSALKYIHSLHQFGRKPTLSRISLLMEKLGNPQDSLKFIHVAGTNGKGSVSTYMAYALQESGLKTGLYTSPYVTEFTERIRLNGKNIGKARLAKITERVKAAADRVAEEFESPREFEVVTAIALLYYYEEKCDIVVMEVGLGGRFDATNVIPAPLVTVITPISLDHTAILGDTIEKIAEEKAAIIKNGTKVVTSPTQAGDALRVIYKRAEEHSAPCFIPSLAFLSEQENSVLGNRFIYRGNVYETSMGGNHQIMNAVTAIEALTLLAPMGYSITADVIAKGIKKVSVPARQEVFSKKPLVILDGSHNPDGVLALRDSLTRYIKESGLKNPKILALTGMMKDKDYVESLDLILPFTHSVIVTRPENERASSAEEMGRIAEKYVSDVKIIEKPCDAISAALKEDFDILLVFGSLYLASETRPVLLKAFKK